MKLQNLICLILAIILFSFTGCSTVSELPESSEKDNKEENGELEVKKTYSILFIGNSYTYYNDMPEAIFKNLAKSAGYDVEITSITKGAYTLEKMADPNDTYGAQVERVLTGTKKYDYVILQEQSARPATMSAGNFYEAVRNLSARIQESGATPILYSTWGRKKGSSTLTDNGWTNESMTWKLAAAYEAIGKELNIPVAHVGLAFLISIPLQALSISITPINLTQPMREVILRQRHFLLRFLMRIRSRLTIMEACPRKTRWCSDKPRQEPFFKHRQFLTNTKPHPRALETECEAEQVTLTG